MRTTTMRSKLTLLFMAFALMLALPAVALADNINDDIADDVNSALQLTAGDASSKATAEVKIVAVGGNDTADGNKQCNIDLASESVTLTFVTPSGVTATALDGATTTPGEMKFTACDVFQTVEFSAGANAVAGNYTVTATYVENTTGSYNNNVNIPIKVNAAADGGTTTPPPPPSDTTGPVIDYVLSPASPDGLNGWYKSNVSLTWSVTDLESASSIVKTGCVDQSITADQAETTYSCSAESDGGSAGPVSVSIKRDGTAPMVTLGSVSGTAGTNGWYTSAVSQTFNASDATSGLPTSFTNPFSVSSSGEGSAVEINSGAVTDNAGNTNNGVSANFKIDLSDPRSIAFQGGPAAGASHVFGTVPAEPTCTAVDDVSGLKDCVVSGYSTAVGTHTLTATATDTAGRIATETRTYTVTPWTLVGFKSPVDMGILNNAKAGATVPLKFEIFQGATELTDTNVVQSFTQKISCASGTSDDIESYATGGTSLRYDSTGGQFIFNWQTPKAAGSCYKVTLTTLDGSKLVADFRLK